jgi:hypothetical protein
MKITKQALDGTMDQRNLADEKEPNEHPMPLPHTRFLWLPG